MGGYFRLCPRPSVRPSRFVAVERIPVFGRRMTNDAVTDKAVPNMLPTINGLVDRTRVMVRLYSYRDLALALAGRPAGICGRRAPIWIFPLLLGRRWCNGQEQQL